MPKVKFKTRIKRVVRKAKNRTVKKIKATRRFLAFAIISTVVLKITAFGLESAGLNLDFTLRELATSVISEKSITLLTNEARARENIALLATSEKLDQAAQKKAEEMVKEGYFAHISPEGKTAWDFMDEVQYPYIFAGENLAVHFETAEEALNGWLTSPSHRENILNARYSETGIGIAKGNFMGSPGTVIVQMFGKSIEDKAVAAKSVTTASRRLVFKNLANAQEKKEQRRERIKQRLAIAKQKTGQKLAVATPPSEVRKSEVRGVQTVRSIESLKSAKMADWNAGKTMIDIFAAYEKTHTHEVLNSIVLTYMGSLVAFFIMRHRKLSHKKSR
jgi:uncharacterized protein YkwD